MSGPFIHLNPNDNVLVARRQAAEGTEVTLPDGKVIRLAHAIPLAHKIACREIGAGERILKYGMPIGLATDDIPAGAHVHVHNIRSAYTPTYALQDANGQSAEAPQ
ncbi:UxaA family hydrolase [Thalassospira sp. MA62]|nr:UxaA family hydrolase [Thalassospira sp. MA62]